MNIEQNVTISIAQDFSKYPAGRYPADGEFNGTRFRQENLVPHLKESKILVVSFDGTAGFGSSFLEEAFGGLIREEGMTKTFLDKHLRISAEDEGFQDFITLTKKYITDAANKACVA